MGIEAHTARKARSTVWSSLPRVTFMRVTVMRAGTPLGGSFVIEPTAIVVGSRHHSHDNRRTTKPPSSGLSVKRYRQPSMSSLSTVTFIARHVPRPGRLRKESEAA